MTGPLTCCPDRMHGYGLGDITAFVRRAIRATGSRADTDLQFEEAWDGIVEQLLAADNHPTELDLINAGCNAIRDSALNWRRHHGVRSNGDRFAAYWDVRTTAPVIERMLDDLAARQVAAALPRRHADVLLAVAAAGSLQGYADAHNLHQATASSRLQTARRAFCDLWFDEETPPAQRGHRRARQPIEHGTRNGYQAHRRRKEQACQDCRAAAQDYNNALAETQPAERRTATLEAAS